MCLVDLPADMLGATYGAFKRRMGAPVLWRLVCKAMRDAAPSYTETWLRSMCASVELVHMVRSMWQCKGMWQYEVYKHAQYEVYKYALRGMPATFNDTWLLVGVARGGNAKVLHALKDESWVQQMWTSDTQKVLAAAGAAGDLEMLKVALAIGMRVSRFAAQHAAKGGNVEMVRLFLVMHDILNNRDLPDHEKRITFEHPVEKRPCSIDLFRSYWGESDLLDRMNQSVLANAVEHGHLLVAQMLALHYNDFALDFRKIGKWAAESGSVPILKWAHENSESVLLVQDLQSQVRRAAEHGRLEALKYLYTQLNPCNLRHLGADRGANLFQYDQVWMHGARHEHVLKWYAEELKRPLHGQIMIRAIQRASGLGTIQYLLEQNCPKAEGPNPSSCPDEYTAAACMPASYRLPVINLLHAHGYDTNTTNPFVFALVGTNPEGLVELLDRLRALNFPIATHMFTEGNFPISTYMLTESEIGTEVAKKWLANLA